MAFGLWFPCSALDIIALSKGAYLPSGMSKVLEYKYVAPILPCQQKSIPLVVVDYTFMEVELLFIVIIILIDWAIEKWSCGVSPLFFHAITNQEKGDWLIWITRRNYWGKESKRSVILSNFKQRTWEKFTTTRKITKGEKLHKCALQVDLLLQADKNHNTGTDQGKLSWDFYHSTFLFFTDIHIRKKDQRITS